VSAPIPPRIPSATQPAATRPLSLARADSGRPGDLILKLLIAAVIVALAIGAYVYFGQMPPAAAGEVTHLTAYPIHKTTNNIPYGSKAAHVEQTFDEIIVVAQVRLHNQTRGPLFLSDMSCLVGLPGEEHRSLAASLDGYDRVFIAYPELMPLRQQPLLRDTTIPAGETVEGQLIFNYPITKDQWDLRRSVDITTSFLHQNDLVLPAPQ
jgi:hypothetical protein